MKIYNTYTREKEDFKPIEEKKVRMYVCGPTVYDYIHIGNARPVIFFDVVHRYFKLNDHEVDYVSNITDVDDKIVNKAQAERVSEAEISEKYFDQYLADCQALNVLPICAMPKVTESIEEIISFIDTLVQDGFAYAVDGDVYFRVEKAAHYGTLSGKKMDDLRAGARVEANDKKENPLDFTLWKKTDVGLTWTSPWGAGRPGWHTECVVMVEHEFKGKIDIHGGGSDLQFPHHENEIAQSLCQAGHRIANTWMHVGRLGLDGEKMSKSIGNVVLVKDLLKDWGADVIRLFMLSTHYRQPISFSYEVLEVAKKEWMKVTQAYDALHTYLDLKDTLDGRRIPMLVFPEQLGAVLEIVDMMEDVKKDFKAAMEDDFNTANAITALYALVKLVNKLLRNEEGDVILIEVLKLFDYVLDALGFAHVKKLLSLEDKQLYRDWQEARENEDFELADQLRKLLQERKIV